MNDYQFMVAGLLLLFTAAFLLFLNSDGYMDRSYLYTWSLLPLVITYWAIELAPGRFTGGFKVFLIFPAIVSLAGFSFLLWEDIEKRLK